MAPSAGKVLLHGKFRYTSLEELADLLAHEMCHIRQHHKWSTAGFYCRYATGATAVEDECEVFEASVKVRRCFAIRNNGGSTVHAAFMFYSHYWNAWTGRGWYSAAAGGSDMFCVTRYRAATLYVHVYNSGSAQSKNEYDSGKDAKLCIAGKPFQVVYDYQGYKYYDAVGELRGDSCGDAAGYWLAQFERVASEDDYEHDHVEVGARRLLLQQGGEGSGGYGEDGEAEEVEVVELSEEEVEAVLHEGPGGRKIVYLDSEEDDTSDMTDAQ